MNKIRICLLVAALAVFAGCQKNTGGVSGSDCGCSAQAEADKKIESAQHEHAEATNKAITPVIKAQEKLSKEKRKAADKVIKANDELIKEQAEAISEVKQADK